MTRSPSYAAAVIRHARPADIAAIVGLVESAYRGESSRAGWTTEADLLDGQRTDHDDVRACLERERSVILLAELEQRLVGCAHVALDLGDDAAAWFGMFAVAPALQGGGIGKQLLVAAETHAETQWRCATMRMTVIDVRDELIAFYERRGYARTGATKPFPYGQPRFGVPRREDLRFTVLEKRLAR